MWIIILFIVVVVLLSIAKKYEADKVNGEATQNGGAVKSEQVKVLSKRSEVKGGSHSTSTYYFILFEFDIDGSRREFQVSSEKFGVIIEGDKGRMSYQGEKFLNFYIERD